MKPEIVSFEVTDRTVRFADGTVEVGVDSVIFCTGYFYSFPFLKSISPAVTEDGRIVRNLYEHSIYAQNPTLAFIGIPQRVVPFPIAEAQSGFVARLWSGRIPLPSEEEMLAWERKLIEDRGGDVSIIHDMKSLRDVAYINRLYEKSMSAKPVEGLANDGKGQIPPFWDEEKAWVRERFPAIKEASRALGEKRREVKSLGELGFDYKIWKEENREKA